MNFKDLSRWIPFLILSLFTTSASAERQIEVVASFTILADMASEIGGRSVNVKSLVGPDKDAHVYEPTPEDVRTLRRASLLIINGMGFEGWIERLVEASGFRGTVVIASQGIKPFRDGSEGRRESKGQAGAEDPHAWQSLPNARTYVANIANAMIRSLPTNETDIRAAARRYSLALDSTDAWVRRELATIPKEKRKVITSHDAFRYFEKEYGVTFLAPQGWTTESQPTAAGVAALIRQARRERITALFVENISDSRLLEQIARESRSRVGGRLYSDALSHPDGPAGTYLDMFRHNVKTLKAGMVPTAGARRSTTSPQKL
jgi:zinc/manganese transport system substrate-binding protein